MAAAAHFGLVLLWRRCLESSHLQMPAAQRAYGRCRQMPNSAHTAARFRANDDAANDASFYLGTMVMPKHQPTQVPHREAQKLRPAPTLMEHFDAYSDEMPIADC